jgi:hypothetical protein
LQQLHHCHCNRSRFNRCIALNHNRLTALSCSLIQEIALAFLDSTEPNWWRYHPFCCCNNKGIPKVKKSKNWSNNKTYNTYNTFIKVYFQRGTRKRHRFCSWIGKKRVKRSNLVDCGVSSFVESYSIDRIDGNICAIETVDTVFRQSAQREIDKSKPQVDPTKGSDAIANTVKETKNLVPSLFGIY